MSGNISCPEVHRWLTEPLQHDVAKSIEGLLSAADVKRVAVMPDVHLAGPVCIGTVIATSNLIYPAAVGGETAFFTGRIYFDIFLENVTGEVFLQVTPNSVLRALANPNVPDQRFDFINATRQVTGQYFVATRRYRNIIFDADTNSPPTLGHSPTTRGDINTRLNRVGHDREMPQRRFHVQPRSPRLRQHFGIELKWSDCHSVFDSSLRDDRN